MLERSIAADFSKKCGKIKPLCGLCLGPRFDTPSPITLTEEYRELGVPFVRTCTAALPRGTEFFVDLARVFPDPALDERFPESYDFAECDGQLAAIRECGAAIYLSIGGRRGASYTDARPHVSADKWARIAEKVILHYNRGWGGGFKHSVKLVEIWPGADLPGGFSGGARAYAEFYRAVACHLKSVYPTLKLGGYSSGGFASLNRYDATPEQRGYVGFLESFLSYIGSRDTAAPLDFFSWRADVESAEELSLHSNYAKNFLAQYGFKRAMSVVSELRLDTGSEPARLSRSYPAALAAALVVASGANIDMMFYSTAYPYSPGNAIFTVDDCLTVHRYAAFGVMAAYGALLRHGTEVQTTDNFRREIYSLAAVSESGGALLIATGSYSGTLVVDIKGSPFGSYSIKGMLGGGRRGEGYSTEEKNIPLGRGRFTMKVGHGEIYLITLS